MRHQIISMHQPLWELFKQVTSSHYSLHSRFAHAINFVNDQSQMITFLSQDLPNAPNTAVIDCVSFDELMLVDNTPLILTKLGFQLHDACFQLVPTTTVWSPHLPELLADRIEYTRQMIEAFLLENNNELSPFENVIYEKLDDLSRKILAAYKAQDFIALNQCVKESIGLGLGLTPSGDDRLVGFLLGCYGQSASLDITVLNALKDAIDQASERTNAISYAMLKEAKEGRFNEWLIDLAVASNSGNKELLEDAVRCVFSIGSRSGGDMLKGFALSLS